MDSEKRNNRIMDALYVVVGIYISIKYIVAHDYMKALMGPVSIAFLLVLVLGARIFRLKLGSRLRNMILFFAFMAFTLGTALRWYDKFALYDVIMHLLSGILFTMMGFCIYARVRDDKTPDLQSEKLLQVTYAFFFAMFVAVIWEVGEFLGFIITGHDSQHMLDTGVFDTMEDLISCSIGGLIMASDYYIFLKSGKKSILIKTIDSFYAANQAK